MELKEYQKNAIKELLAYSKELLRSGKGKKLVFQAPTGSGKTVMMAETLKQLVSEPEMTELLSFIWVAPRQLHIQSKEKLEIYFEPTRTIKCSYFEDLDDRKIQDDEILFFNWESINKTDNIYIRENEQEDNLSIIIERTRDEGRKVILIIDESHFAQNAEAANRLKNDIDADFTIEVSATATSMGDKNVNITLDEVKKDALEGKEGAMIKKAVSLNENFENIVKDGQVVSKLSSGTEELVLDAAITKRLEIARLFDTENENINPLILIQLPDRRTDLEDEIKSKVINILKDKYNIKTENGKLAIWLSGEHVNEENIAKPDNETEVLIFKQALALGWDCPRSQILVLFRDWKSIVFSIQTIGRIMRMPNPNRGYYGNDKLNYGYIYTNIGDIEITKDNAKDYISTYVSKRIATYQNIDLTSYYRERHRETTRLSPLFTQMFLEKANEYGLKKEIDRKARNPEIKFITNFKAEDIDKLVGRKIAGKETLDELSVFDLQKLFDYFIRNNLAPFYPEDRSIGRCKEAIYEFFKVVIGIDYEEKEAEIIKMVLDGANIQHFINVLNLSKDDYKLQVEKRENRLTKKVGWNVPEVLNYGSNYKVASVKSCIMEPFYGLEAWSTEIAFIEFLSKAKKVEWWFKNGDRDATFFAVPRFETKKVKGVDVEEEFPFYVDFIVQFKDGSIGLFDTKKGITARDAPSRAEGLQRYIMEQNKKGKKLWGGIVIEDRKSWRYNHDEKYVYRDGDEKNWELLMI